MNENLKSSVHEDVFCWRFEGGERAKEQCSVPIVKHDDFGLFWWHIKERIMLVLMEE